MRKCTKRSNFVRSRAVLSVSIIVALLTTIEIPSSAFSLRSKGPSQTQSNLTQTNDSEGDADIASSNAIASERGVLLSWRTRYESDNLGFNIYRLKAGHRTRINREIIPGSVFSGVDKIRLPGGSSYSYLDPYGRLDSTYEIESVGLHGKLKAYAPLKPVAVDKIRAYQQSAPSSLASSESNIHSFHSEYAAVPAQQVEQTGSIEDQWAVAAQPGLKIFIKSEGWYRVTQQEMAGAGFTPIVDMRNLLLYVDGQEMAIRTSRSSGQLGSGDYLEFYGRGLDTRSTDTRTYYLIAGTRAGRRVSGDVQHDAAPLEPPRQPATLTALASIEPTPKTWFGLLFGFLVGDGAPKKTEGEASGETKKEPKGDRRREAIEPGPADFSANPQQISSTSLQQIDQPQIDSQAAADPALTPVAESTIPAVARASRVAPAEERQSIVRRKRGRGKRKRKPRQPNVKHHHSVSGTSSAAPSFDYTVEQKAKLVFFGGLINGDDDNFFGQVISGNNVTQTLTSLSPEFTANGQAKLEIALQGVNDINHQVNVQFNEVSLGTLTFFGRAHHVQTFSIPLVQLRNGDNTIKFSAPSGDTSLVDYTRLTYPHAFQANDDSLRCSLRPNQAAVIDGFSTQNLLLIDHTDPLSVKVTRPFIHASPSGFAIDIPASAGRSKSRRLLSVIAEGQVKTAAGFALNQPSTLNLNTNGSDFLILSHKTLIASALPLVNARQAQGLTVSVADVEDVYDEFNFGARSPQALKDFLSVTTTRWATTPRYIVLLGDASYDSRNYLGGGDHDFVPTKLVDATYSETASDDWLSDFNGDGAADIPVGRIPVRTIAEANLVISKIVNFAPANVPQSALLVADAQGNYYYSFEAANDEVQGLISPPLAVERLNRRTEPSDAAAKANIIAKFNQGQALVNYTGHGNVDTWTGGAIFTSTDASALTNGNKLPFVVVMDCLNGYFQAPLLEGIAESLMKAPNGGAVAAFASSGLTLPDGQHAMSRQLYILLYGSQSIPLGDAIKTAKAATSDIDVRRTWIFFGDPSMRIR